MSPASGASNTGKKTVRLVDNYHLRESTVAESMFKQRHATRQGNIGKPTETSSFSLFPEYLRNPFVFTCSNIKNENSTKPRISSTSGPRCHSCKQIGKSQFGERDGEENVGEPVNMPNSESKPQQMKIKKTYSIISNKIGDNNIVKYIDNDKSEYLKCKCKQGTPTCTRNIASERERKPNNSQVQEQLQNIPWNCAMKDVFNPVNCNMQDKKGLLYIYKNKTLKTKGKHNILGKNGNNTALQTSSHKEYHHSEPPNSHVMNIDTESERKPQHMNVWNRDIRSAGKGTESKGNKTNAVNFKSQINLEEFKKYGPPTNSKSECSLYPGHPGQKNMGFRCVKQNNTVNSSSNIARGTMAHLSNHMEENSLEPTAHLGCMASSKKTETPVYITNSGNITQDEINIVDNSVFKLVNDLSQKNTHGHRSVRDEKTSQVVELGIKSRTTWTKVAQPTQSSDSESCFCPIYPRKRTICMLEGKNDIRNGTGPVSSRINWENNEDPADSWSQSSVYPGKQHDIPKVKDTQQCTTQPITSSAPTIPLFPWQQLTCDYMDSIKPVETVHSTSPETTKELEKGNVENYSLKAFPPPLESMKLDKSLCLCTRDILNLGADVWPETNLVTGSEKLKHNDILTYQIYNVQCNTCCKQDALQGNTSYCNNKDCYRSGEQKATLNSTKQKNQYLKDITKGVCECSTAETITGTEAHPEKKSAEAAQEEHCYVLNLSMQRKEELQPADVTCCKSYRGGNCLCGETKYATGTTAQYSNPCGPKPSLKVKTPTCKCCTRTQQKNPLLRIPHCVDKYDEGTDVTNICNTPLNLSVQDQPSAGVTKDAGSDIPINLDMKVSKALGKGSRCSDRRKPTNSLSAGPSTQVEQEGGHISESTTPICPCCAGGNRKSMEVNQDQPTNNLNALNYSECPLNLSVKCKNICKPKEDLKLSPIPNSCLADGMRITHSDQIQRNDMTVGVLVPTMQGEKVKGNAKQSECKVVQQKEKYEDTVTCMTNTSESAEEEVVTGRGVKVIRGSDFVKIIIDEEVSAAGQKDHALDIRNISSKVVCSCCESGPPLEVILKRKCYGRGSPSPETRPVESKITKPVELSERRLSRVAALKELAKQTPFDSSISLATLPSMQTLEKMYEINVIEPIVKICKTEKIKKVKKTVQADETEMVDKTDKAYEHEQTGEVPEKTLEHRPHVEPTPTSESPESEESKLKQEILNTSAIDCLTKYTNLYMQRSILADPCSPQQVSSAKIAAKSSIEMSTVDLKDSQSGSLHKIFENSSMKVVSGVDKDSTLVLAKAPYSEDDPFIVKRPFQESTGRIVGDSEWVFFQGSWILIPRGTIQTDDSGNVLFTVPQVDTTEKPKENGTANKKELASSDFLKIEMAEDIHQKIIMGEQIEPEEEMLITSAIQLPMTDDKHKELDMTDTSKHSELEKHNTVDTNVVEIDEDLQEIVKGDDKGDASGKEVEGGKTDHEMVLLLDTPTEVTEDKIQETMSEKGPQVLPHKDKVIQIITDESSLTGDYGNRVSFSTLRDNKSLKKLFNNPVNCILNKIRTMYLHEELLRPTDTDTDIDTDTDTDVEMNMDMYSTISDFIEDAIDKTMSSPSEICRPEKVCQDFEIPNSSNLPTEYELVVLMPPHESFQLEEVVSSVDHATIQEDLKDSPSIPLSETQSSGAYFKKTSRHVKLDTSDLSQSLSRNVKVDTADLIQDKFILRKKSKTVATDTGDLEVPFSKQSQPQQARRRIIRTWREAEDIGLDNKSDTEESNESLRKKSKSRTRLFKMFKRKKSSKRVSDVQDIMVPTTEPRRFSLDIRTSQYKDMKPEASLSKKSLKSMRKAEKKAAKALKKAAKKALKGKRKRSKDRREMSDESVVGGTDLTRKRSKDRAKAMTKMMASKSLMPTGVTPEDIGHCLRRGFRPDNMALSGEVCFLLNNEKRSFNRGATGSLMSFTEHDTPQDFLVTLGFSGDEAANAIKDEEIKNRLRAAVIEARIWVQHLTRTQGTLIYLLAYKCKPRIMRYYLLLVEAIVNVRITNVVKLDGIMRLLERVEAGDVSLPEIFANRKDDDEELEVQKQTRLAFVAAYKIAERETQSRDMEMEPTTIGLIRVLAGKYRSPNHHHLQLLATYIGQSLLYTEVQLDAAFIYLSRIETDDVKKKEFEEYCGINREHLKALTEKE